MNVNDILKAMGIQDFQLKKYFNYFLLIILTFLSSANICYNLTHIICNNIIR